MQQVYPPLSARLDRGLPVSGLSPLSHDKALVLGGGWVLGGLVGTLSWSRCPQESERQQLPRLTPCPLPSRLPSPLPRACRCLQRAVWVEGQGRSVEVLRGHLGADPFVILICKQTRNGLQVTRPVQAAEGQDPPIGRVGPGLLQLGQKEGQTGTGWGHQGSQV